MSKLFWHDFAMCSVVDDLEGNSWIVIGSHTQGWSCYSTNRGVNMLAFETREDAKLACEAKMLAGAADGQKDT